MRKLGSNCVSHAAHYRLCLLHGALGLLILVSLLLTSPPRVYSQAQSTLPSYWQYPASGRLLHVLPADVTRNGVDDFLVVDENRHVDLINGSGDLIWTYVAPDDVTAVAVLEQETLDGTRQAVITLGLPGRLSFLSAAGDEIREVQLADSVQSSAASETADILLNEPVIPIDVVPFVPSGSLSEEALVLLSGGELLRIGLDGTITWQHNDHPSDPAGTPPSLLIADLDSDGQDEVVLAVLNPRRFGQLILFDDDRVLWDLSLSRSVTALESITFREDRQPLIAVGTTSGHVSVYDYLRRRHWLRTMNTPISSLEEVRLPGQSLLAAGTDSGVVTALNEQGRRVWTAPLADEASEAVVALSATVAMPLNESDPFLAVTVHRANETGTANAFLLDSRGKVLALLEDVDANGLTQFVDSNNDHNNELLVPRFATLELLGMGVGNSSNVQEWEYSLNAAPRASLVSDLDMDGNEEMLIGTEDGRILSLAADRSINWLFDAGGGIRQLADLGHEGGQNRSLVVIGDVDFAAAGSASWIQLREANGERLWERPLGSEITALTVADTFPGGDQEIIIGTENGSVLILSSAGEAVWESQAFAPNSAVKHLAFHIDGSDGGGEILAAGETKLIGLSIQEPDLPGRELGDYEQEITGIYVNLLLEDTDANGFTVATADGRLHATSADGKPIVNENWPIEFGSRVTSDAQLPNGLDALEGIPTTTPLLLGTERGELVRLDLFDELGTITWQFQGLGTITSVDWYDQNLDGNPDLAVSGNDAGRILLYENTDGDTPVLSSAPLELTSAVFDVSTLSTDRRPLPDLIAIGENGLVQLFRNRENRPPLLTGPLAISEQGQYSISVDVSDVEGDEIIVNLEVFNPDSNTWEGQGTELLSDGSGTIFWPLTDLPESPLGLRYRFTYSDGSYTSTMTPPLGPAPLQPSPFSTVAPVVLVGMAVTGLVLALAFVRQSQTADARASRFYRRLKEQPAQTLILLEQQVKAGNTPNLMPLLATRARQHDDKVITNLADGLFLLPEQPRSGISILTRTLTQQSERGGMTFDDRVRWQTMFATSEIFLEAQSIADLALLSPQWDQLVAVLTESGSQQNAFQLLGPILSNLRDSERVDLVDDRLVYLNEADVLIKKARRELLTYHPSVEHMLVSAIVRRWSGMISAEIADLKGRAELVITLKTRRLAPGDQTTIALDVHNSGRSAAENIVATLDENPAYSVDSLPPEIVYLPPGRTREIRFAITPQVSDRFRVGLTLTFNDHSEFDREVAFGDMVHILPPVRDFTTINNPYTPGTPLRQGSLLFYGRESLFGFIAENAGQRSYRNVLILVGQRRTGKTSALLRLGEHLPQHLMPVYIDCQSLGVVPGMPALLEELAWTICDALSKRGIEIDVPDLDAWQKDPTRLFQRQFLPDVNALLPEGTTLLLVFDEFEAFETLVAEGILPSTFFTYLRHLMQHSEQLNFIFVGTRRLEEMTADYWSVLFNIALYRKIGFLDDDAATRLITEPVAPYLIYDDLALDKILRVTAGHPYFLQLVCYTVVKQANLERSGYVTISSLNAALDEMLSLGEVHFAYLWQRSTLEERAILAVIAHLMDATLPFLPEDIMQKLSQYDVHLDHQALVAALNSLVERDVLREVTEEAKSLYEMKLGLVSSWVARNKSIAKLFTNEAGRSYARKRAEATGVKTS